MATERMIASQKKQGIYTGQSDRSLEEQQNAAGQAAYDQRLAGMPTSNAITPITPEALQPTSPLTVTAPKSNNTTAAAVIGGASAAPLQQAQENVNAASAGVTAAQDETKGILDTIREKVTGIKKVQEAAATSPEEIQREAANKILTELNTSIADEQIKMRAEQDAIKGRGDLTQASQQVLMDNVAGNYGRKLADLAIRQAAAATNLTAFTAAADRALKLKIAPLETDLKYYTDFALANANKLSDDEKDKLSLIIDEKNKIIASTEAVEKSKTDLLNTALQNGVKIPDAVVAQVLSATSAAEASAILARNGIVLQDPKDAELKQSQIDENYQQIRKLKAETDAIGAPAITNLAAGPYAPVITTILGSTKFTDAQKKTFIQSVNAGQDPFSIVKNQAKDIMGQTAATKLTALEASRDAFLDFTNDLQAFYDAGGQTGLIRGNFEKVSNRLGQVSDPKLVTLAAELQGSIQSYRNAISGTAYSDQEGKDINSIFPGIDKSKDLNAAITKGRTRLFDSSIDAAYRQPLGPTYDTIKKLETNTGNAGPVPKGTDGASYGYPGYVSDGTQWVQK